MLQAIQRLDLYVSPHQLKRLFPNASQATLAANAQDHGSGVPELEAGAALPHAKPQPHQAPALVRAVPGEAEGIRRIIVRFTLRRVKLLDPDNAAASVKDCLDGCRHAGLLPDDQWHQIKLEVEQEKVLNYKSERTVLEIVWPANP